MVKIICPECGKEVEIAGIYEAVPYHQNCYHWCGKCMVPKTEDLPAQCPENSRDCPYYEPAFWS